MNHEAFPDLAWPAGTEPIVAPLRDLSAAMSLATLRDTARRVCSEGRVAVSFASREYLNVAIMWVAVMRDCGIDNYLIVGGDAETVEKLNSLGAATVRAELTTGTLSPEYQSPVGYSSRGLAVSALKYPVVAALLDEGLDVVMSDIDALWCQNPSFPSGVHLAFQRVVYHPPFIVRRWGFAACAGFVFFRSSDLMRRLIRDCVRQHLEVHCDQVALNLALLENDPQWEFPEAYSQSLAGDAVSPAERFASFAEHEFFGSLDSDQANIVALRHDWFWRHAFVSPRGLVICHPNSEKDEASKIQTLEKCVALRRPNK